MPKRLPYEAAILAALLLGSCDSLPASFTKADAERLDYAEINIRRAAQASSEMVDRVERGEARITELEQQVRELESRADESRRIQNENARLLEERWQIYLHHTH